jgi:hypothetical protein
MNLARHPPDECNAALTAHALERTTDLSLNDAEQAEFSAEQSIEIHSTPLVGVACGTLHYSKSAEGKSCKIPRATGASPVGKISISCYAEKHGFENLCRVLFNVSEFVFVD